MRYYKIDEALLKALLTDSIELSYLREGGVDNWTWYCDSIQDGIEQWLDQHQDVVSTWDEDDPRRDDFYIDDIAKEEINIYYKKYLLEEKR